MEDIQQIKSGKIDNLSISYNSEDGMVILYTPNMDDSMEHYHIELSIAEYITLYSFLSKYAPVPIS